MTATHASRITMRTLVLEDFGRMVVAERPRPAPGPGEALVRTIATGICGSDLHGYTGENGRRRIGQVMGHETVGRVVDIGPADGTNAAAHLAPGMVVVLNPSLSCGRCTACTSGRGHLCADRRVIGVDPTISSAFADYLAVPAANLVPFAAESLLGALVEPLAVGANAATRGSVSAGEDVLVLGGGPIGQAVALACQRRGAASVTVSEPSNERRALVERLGFATIDPTSTDVVAAAQERTGGPGMDVTVDAVGVSATLASGLAATASGGRCVLVGMGQPRIELDAYAVSTFERAVIGAFCYPANEFSDTARWAADHPELLRPLLHGSVTPEQAPDSFADLAAGRGPAGKVVVAFSDCS